jgi:LacI family transcriptional regulator
MPTIEDVAKRAGVAPITVSRVVNNSGYFSEQTRLRVERAIAELGYVPNTLARGLRSKRTNTLALVLTDITNPFFTIVARGVEDTASHAGYTVIYCNTDESQEEENKYIQLLLQKQVDGFILVPARIHSKSVERIHAQGSSVVVIDRRIPEKTTDVVRCDSEKYAYSLTKILINQGHRRIAALSGPRDVSISQDRLNGYKRAMQASNLNIDDLIFYGDLTHDSGYSMTQLALGLSQTPTAIFACNNFISIGALKALQAMHIKVPEDISIVGFDDLPLSLVIDPFLTVVAQPAYKMGQQATQILLSRITGKAAHDFQEIILPAKIIERRSHKPIYT